MKKSTLIYIFLFFQSTSLFCQLERGDWMANLSGSLFLENKADYEPAINTNDFKPTIGYMVFKNWMVGVRYSFRSELFPSDTNAEFHYNQRTFTPFLRGSIINKKRLCSYLFISASFIKRKETRLPTFFAPRITSKREYTASTFYSGIGFSYFISPSIALESELGLLIEKSGRKQITSTSQNLFTFDLRLATYIRDLKNEDFDLTEHYLKKGNSNISGMGHFADQDDSSPWGTVGPKAYRFAYSMNFGYDRFVNNRLSIGGRVHFGHEKQRQQKDINIFNVSVDGNITAYFQLTDDLFFAPSANISWQHDFHQNWYDIQISTDTASMGPFSFPTLNYQLEIRSFYIDYSRFSLNVSPALKHFYKKRSILESGFQVGQSLYFREGDYTKGEVSLNFFAGVEYFFSKNTSLSGRLFFKAIDSDIRTETTSLDRQGGLAFEFRYYFFN